MATPRHNGVIIRQALERVGIADNLPHLVGTGHNRVRFGRYANQQVITGGRQRELSRRYSSRRFQRQGWLTFC
jgi:hypothetical protein